MPKRAGARAKAAQRAGASTVPAPDDASPPASPQGPPAIRAQGLTKVFPSGDGEVAALRDVSFTVERGEWVSVMGPSGSGKSTLLNLLGLLDTPTSGALELMGEDATGLTRNEAALLRQRSLGFVFQGFNLMAHLDALHNVMLPLAIAGVPRAKRLARARDLLQQVGLADRARHKPRALSGGQKQRVAIARAIALNPPVILADEPTGNLDSRTGAEVMALFGDLNARGTTIVQVTHDEQVARHARRILRVRDGELASIDLVLADRIVAEPQPGRHPLPRVRGRTLAPEAAQALAKKAAPRRAAVPQPGERLPASTRPPGRGPKPADPLRRVLDRTRGEP